MTEKSTLRSQNRLHATAFRQIQAGSPIQRTCLGRPDPFAATMNTSQARTTPATPGVWRTTTTPFCALAGKVVGRESRKRLSILGKARQHQKLFDCEAQRLETIATLAQTVGADDELDHGKRLGAHVRAEASTLTI
jgi:hypothetical protein